MYYRYATHKLSKNIKEVRPEPEYLDNFIFRGPEMAFIYQHNSFDNHMYPTRGIRVDIKYRQSFKTKFLSVFNFPDSLGYENEISEVMNPYWHLSADLESYFPLGKKFSFISEFALGLSANEKPFPDNYYLGGYRYNQRSHQVAFVGLQSHELLQGNYVKEKFGLQFQPVSKLYLSVLYNLVFVTDDISTLLDDILTWNDDTRYMGLGAGFTYKTPVGPVSVFFGSRTDTWNPLWYLNIGYTF